MGWRATYLLNSRVSALLLLLSELISIWTETPLLHPIEPLLIITSVLLVLLVLVVLSQILLLVLDRWAEDDVDAVVFAILVVIICLSSAMHSDQNKERYGCMDWAGTYVEVRFTYHTNDTSPSPLHKTHTPYIHTGPSHTAALVEKGNGTYTNFVPRDLACSSGTTVLVDRRRSCSIRCRSGRTCICCWRMCGRQCWRRCRRGWVQLWRWERGGWLVRYILGGGKGWRNWNGDGSEDQGLGRQVVVFIYSSERGIEHVIDIAWDISWSLEAHR